MKNKILLFALFIFILFVKVKGQDLTSCDYLIIAPSTFLSTTTWPDDLLALQQSRGFSPYISITSDGTTTEGIKDIISVAYNNDTQLKYVLLIGNGSHITSSSPATRDAGPPNIYTIEGVTTNAANFSEGNFIPFWSVTSSNFWGNDGVSEVASDAPYISELNGNGTVYIGRIPADTKNEMENYINKLTTYYNNISTYSEHNSKELYIGKDITDTINGCLASDVNALRDDLINDYIPSHINVTQLNVSEYILNGEFGFSHERSQLFENALNSGVSLISMLSTQGGPVDLGGWYWNSDEADFNFTNINELPFLLGMNCMQGYVNDRRWDNYNKSAMRELMMFANGGIIGSIAPTEGTVQSINGSLLNNVHDKIFNESIVNVAELHSILKMELEQNHQLYEFFANGLTLFADPSMSLSINLGTPGSSLSIDSFPFNDTGTTEGESNDYEINGSNCGDVAYSLVLTETKVLNLTLCASGTDYDTQMGIFNADGSSTGYENDDNEDCSFNRQYSFLNEISLDAGSYYVVVDGYSTYEGNYELSVEEIGGSGGQTPDFTIPNLPYSHTYNNIGVSNDWELALTGGDDIAYKLVLSNASTINVTLCSSNTDFDTMLEIFNADGSSTGQFNDDNEDCSFNRQFSYLENISLAAGTYFIVVDGYNGYEGNYEIQVNYSTTGNEILSLPFTDIGSIVGENDNWNVEGGDGSDFSYNLVLENATTIDITLCSSDTDYDSKLEIFNEDGTTTGFYNDDYEDCSFNRQYSYLETISLDAGNYYVVVDGYDGATGNYGLSITEVQQKNASIVLNKNSKNTYKLFVEPQCILAAFDYEAEKKNSKITFRNRNVFTDKNLNQKVIDNADGYIVNLEKELNGDKPLPKKYFIVSPPVDKRIIEEYDREKRKKQEDGKRNELILNPAYPDPANPSTTISYYLPERTNVSIKIYNSLGRLIKTLVSETQQSGEHSLLWNGKNNNGNQVSSGIYFIKFSALDKNLSQKIILLK